MGLYILDHGSSGKLELGHMNVVAAMRLRVAVLWAPGCSHPAFGPTSFGPKSEGLLSARSNLVYIFPRFTRIIQPGQHKQMIQTYTKLLIMKTK